MKCIKVISGVLILSGILMVPTVHDIEIAWFRYLMTFLESFIILLGLDMRYL
jgi:hypothetical protein